MTTVSIKSKEDFGKKAEILLKSSIIAEKDFSFVNNEYGNYTITIGKRDASSGDIIGESIEFCL